MQVVIVGAGPAGLISALNLMQEGVIPLILERLPEIKSTACGEACDVESLNKIPFNSGPYASKRVRGAQVLLANGLYTYINKESVVLDRTNWLKGMAKEIERRGGQIRLNSEVTGIQENSIQLKSGERIDYDILLGADGPNSCVARHIGLRHKLIVASQYKIAFDASSMNHLEFYFDRRFSAWYSWIFPKDGMISVGTGGDFTQLDAFLSYKGINGAQIIEKERGIVPCSGIGKLTQHNIALIGDSGSMPNPLSLGGLAPIIYAARILATNITNLQDYEDEVKRHPIGDPLFLKAKQALLKLTDKDLADIGSWLTKTQGRRLRFLRPAGIIRHPSLFPKLQGLVSIYKATKTCIRYGW